MGRDEKHWPDAEVFRPSRFFADAAFVVRGGGDFGYLPFGSGRRSCPGMQLGLYALELGMAQLLHCFDWSLPAGVKLDMGDVFGLTAPKVVRLTAVPWPRLPCPLF
jgi:ferulate-5-hydroxylase